MCTSTKPRKYIANHRCQIEQLGFKLPCPTCVNISYDIISAGTPMPNVTIIRSLPDSLLVYWTVKSTKYLNNTKYTVYWSGPSAETYKTNSTGYNNYTIKGLRSNSPYTIAVEAIDPFGRQNSTNQLYFTSPTG